MIVFRGGQQTSWATALTGLPDDLEHAFFLKLVRIHDEVLTTALPMLNLLCDAEFLAQWTVCLLEISVLLSVEFLIVPDGLHE